MKDRASSTDTRNARTWLFVPGDRPDRFQKAAASGSDVVICDLEDAVDQSRKETARLAVAEWLRNGGRAWVRVNATSTAFAQLDLREITGAPGLQGIVVPKAADPHDIEKIADRTGTHILALIETSIGAMNVHAIASSHSVAGIAFGAIDFATDVNASLDSSTVAYARSLTVLAGRSAGIAVIDGVTTDFKHLEKVHHDASETRSLGFTGKLCIHPAQVEVVRNAFQPRIDEVEWARSILARSSGSDGADSLNGKMIDRPIIDRARRILAALD